MKKQVSSHALAAKQIRSELKQSFPSIKFRVIAKTYAGGDSINIYWDNGVPTNVVEKILCRYTYGRFNGMEDIYEYSNNRDDIAQVKYIFYNRCLTDDILRTYFEKFKKERVGWDGIVDLDETNNKFLFEWGFWTPRNFICNYLSNINLER